MCSSTIEQFGLVTPECNTPINQQGFETFPYSQSVIEISSGLQVRAPASRWLAC